MAMPILRTMVLATVMALAGCGVEDEPLDNDLDISTGELIDGCHIEDDPPILTGGAVFGKASVHCNQHPEIDLTLWIQKKTPSGWKRFPVAARLETIRPLSSKTLIRPVLRHGRSTPIGSWHER